VRFSVDVEILGWRFTIDHGDEAVGDASDLSGGALVSTHVTPAEPDDPAKFGVAALPDEQAAT
jgi:hypothetical protein